MNQVEVKINETHADLIDQARDMGKQDGGINVPAQDDAIVSPYEIKLKHQYQSLVDQIATDREKQFTVISYEKINTLRKEKENITTDNINQDVSRIKSREKDLLSKEESKYVGQVTEVNSNAKLKSTQAKKVLAEREFKKECKKEGRTITDKKITSNTAYWIGLFILGISELMINFEAFKVFKMNLIETGIVALSLIVIPGLAHFVGQMSKQFKVSKSKGFYGVMIGGITFLNFALFGVVAYLRLLQDIPKISLWFFFILAVLLFVAGFLMAYFHVDSSDSFYAAYLENKKVQNEFEKQEEIRTKTLKEIENVYSKLVESIKDEYEEKVIHAKNILKRKDNEINEIIGQYNELVSTYGKYEEQINSNFKESVQEYRIANLSTRITKQPSIWINEPNDLKLNNIKFEKE